MNKESGYIVAKEPAAPLKHYWVTIIGEPDQPVGLYSCLNLLGIMRHLEIEEYVLFSTSSAGLGDKLVTRAGLAAIEIDSETGGE